jgi:hypothetical protein
VDPDVPVDPEDPEDPEDPVLPLDPEDPEDPEVPEDPEGPTAPSRFIARNAPAGYVEVPSISVTKTDISPLKSSYDSTFPAIKLDSSTATITLCATVYARFNSSVLK